MPFQLTSAPCHLRERQASGEMLGIKDMDGVEVLDKEEDTDKEDKDKRTYTSL